ncbi:hypothetical protein BD309DRAFT_719284 [Dichomitus squalens]|uniref:Uncharacterized protein n=1 Tax=Dichomitus squalens TaxID=114155 RepID=A0A4Q9N0P5_9APHY|nr:uncharacterized protein DICSQDRAFT_153447 [Dichomitus squalens LYAD-421 SS1]EJF64434.1 hypothetical protein DICSQDRAFT_153447 [Dichomitus squalens LYAD-421 SS1]TBU34010.1 hypothetical protein BD311DRAFT_746973 [Dichomitus squalens]TBU45412.1 hypothetical protein BD309DRAFT_719284 [Dichomitus squalens]TBU54065.1 hypothetical protein BD310DRAFT_107166 [Dichomitus squalens]
MNARRQCNGMLAANMRRKVRAISRDRNTSNELPTQICSYEGPSEETTMRHGHQHNAPLTAF